MLCEAENEDELRDSNKGKEMGRGQPGDENMRKLWRFRAVVRS